MEIPDCRHFPGVGKKIIFLSVETMKKKNNYCHLELNKRSFQFDDPNEELKTFVRMFQVLS